jgi:hypothetical protein
MGEGYAQRVQSITVTGGSAPDVELRVEGGTPVTIRVVDAATGGVPSNANASVMDAKGGFVGGGMQRDEEGVRVYLQPGRYTVTGFAPGYVPGQKVEFTAPVSEVRVALHRAGRVVFRAAEAHRVRIVTPGAAKPVWNGNVGPGGTPAAEFVPPGTYVLEILTNAGAVDKSLPVTVIAGQTTTVQLD